MQGKKPPLFTCKCENGEEKEEQRNGDTLHPLVLRKAEARERERGLLLLRLSSVDSGKLRQRAWSLMWKKGRERRDGDVGPAEKNKGSRPRTLVVPTPLDYYPLVVHYDTAHEVDRLMLFLNVEVLSLYFSVQPYHMSAPFPIEFLAALTQKNK